MSSSSQKLNQYISSFHEDNEKVIQNPKKQGHEVIENPNPKATPIQNKSCHKQNRSPLINTLQVKDFKTFLEFTN